MSLTIDQLQHATTGGAAGIRARIPLVPLGGPGDKVFPPTYAVDGRAEIRYALEQRRIGGESVTCVVLDSVASQANRMELALLRACRAGEVRLPLVSADFTRFEDLAGYDRISSLEAPHRVFDAILRDSLLDGRWFRLSDVGRAITEATVKDAQALYRYSPATLVFGGWDSTGPKGGRGAKYERTITSEVVGIGVELGAKTSSRIDPLGIERDAGTVYQASDGNWTLEAEEAARDAKGQPVLYGGSSDDRPGRPSQVNHGNIRPSIDRLAGGVTVDGIVATTVISLVAIRRIGFAVGTDGRPLEGDARVAVETAGRTVLAALALAAEVLAFDEGFDLRSRCVLVAEGGLEFELLGRDGSAPASFTLGRADALGLLGEAVARAEAVGLTWEAEEVLLTPTDRLVTLIRKSRDLVAAGVGEQ